MGWQEAREAYQRLGRQNAQTDENLIARRIIAGLGFPRATAALGRIERAITGSRFDDSPMFDRAKAMFTNALLEYSDHAELGRRWAIVAVSGKNAFETVNKVYDQLNGVTAFADGQWPVIFARAIDSTICYVYTPWWTPELDILTPPFEVLEMENLGDYRLVRQEAMLFV